MPWRSSKGFDVGSKKETMKEIVDQLPLVTPSETTDSATPSYDSESKSDCSSALPLEKREPNVTPRHVTTVTICDNQATTKPETNEFVTPTARKQQLERHSRIVIQQNPLHLQARNVTYTPPPPPPPPPQPIISYEKNKSVRIIVKDEDNPQGFGIPVSPCEKPLKRIPSNASSRSPRTGEPVDNCLWRESLCGGDKSRDVSSWIERQRPSPISSSDLRSFSKTPEKLKDEHGVKVRPLLETSWKGASHNSVLDEPPSSEECQRSTSTLVNTNISKIGKSSTECQRGCISIFCGISVVIGSAVCLRLPGLLLTYGVGSFLAAFGVCLLLAAVPLAYLECGLAQFSNNSVIGIWSLVPLSRGIGWSTVIGCLYWGATSAGLAAPWFHYLVAQNDPDILQVPSMCKLLNGSDFDPVTYYRHCVYNLTSSWDKGVDLSLTWSLPTGLITILMVASLSVTGGPSLLGFISAFGSLIALIGYGAQFYVAFLQFANNEVSFFKEDFHPLLELFVPNINTLLTPEIWLAAMSQALLCLGPGVGMLLNHCANNVFRHSLRKHLWFLTMLTILSTLLVTVTTVMEAKLFVDHLSVSSHTKYESVGAGHSGNLETSMPLTTTPDHLVLTDGHNGTEATSGSTGVDDPIALGLTSTSNCLLYTSRLTDFSCTNIPPGLTRGVPFILSSHLVTFAMERYPSWLSSIIENIIFIGFLGAGVATSCVCMHVGVVAAREARSVPPAVAALVLMAVLSVVAAPMSTQAGASLIHLVDYYVLMPGLLWPPVATMAALTTCHGVTKIRKDMTFMLESTVAWFWMPIWAILLPVLLLGISCWAFYVDWQELGIVKGPEWRLGIVWCLRIGLLISMPITAIIVVNSQLAYGFKDKVLSSLQSSREWGDWGPQDPIEHHNWRRWREDETLSYASLERRLASKSRPLTYTHSTLSSTSTSTLARLKAKYRSHQQHQHYDF